MLESLWSVRLTAGAPLAGTPSTPILTCLTKEMITKLNIPNQKGGRKGQRRTCSWCPCCQQTAHSRTTSLRILYIGGWNHSDLEFIISLCDLLIITPSLTCLLMLSLFDFVTFALNWLSSPRWFSSICFLTKHDSLSSVPSLCSPPRCSFALVYRFLDVSPIYIPVFVPLGRVHTQFRS